MSEDAALSERTPTDLDAVVTEVERRLRAYVEVARGVREEFPPQQADLDPRVEDAAHELGLSLGRLEDAFEGELGFVPEIGAVWGGEEVEDPEQPAVEMLVEEFRIGMVVGVQDGTSPDQLDAVLPLIDDGVNQLADRLWDQGFTVTEFYVARGEDASLDAFGADVTEDADSPADEDAT